MQAFEHQDRTAYECEVSILSLSASIDRREFQIEVVSKPHLLFPPLAGLRCKPIQN
jgi:hypothetical protein